MSGPDRIWLHEDDCHPGYLGEVFAEPESWMKPDPAPYLLSTPTREAAEEMLEALKVTLFVIDRITKNTGILNNAGYTRNKGMLSLKDVVAAARAAISKAEPPVPSTEPVA